MYPDEIACLDVHLDTELFCTWLQQNIPTMKTIENSRFNLPKISNKRAQLKESMSGLSLHLRPKDRHMRSIMPSPRVNNNLLLNINEYD
jgi:hypothetical protein